MKRVLVLGCALLAGCSTTQLVYNKLDWYAAWQVGKYVEIDDRLEELFDRGITSLWRWHRSTQLPLYVADLREIAAAVDRPVTPEQILGYSQRIEAHLERIFMESLPHAVGFLRAMDDTQVQAMLERSRQRREERRKQAEKAEAERDDSAAALEESVKAAQKGLKRWLGSLSAEQKELVRESIVALRIDDATRRARTEMLRRHSDQLAAAFAEVLGQRHQPEFADRLRDLVLDPQLPHSAELEQLKQETNRAGAQWLSRLSHTLSAQQRAHLQDELGDLIEDLTELAAQAP